MTKPKTQRSPPDPSSGEPTAGSPAPDTWPFELPTEQRELVPEPEPDDRDAPIRAGATGTGSAP